jgi:hypothetical protein
MRKIDIDNYEEFLLDFLEGNLDEKRIEQLRAFALLHPELEINLETDGLPYLELGNENFEAKEELKKFSLPIVSEMDDTALLNDPLLQLIEGQLPAFKTNELLQKIETDELLKRDYQLYQKTKLVADTTIEYPHKKALKRSGRVVPLFAKWSAVAAAALLVLTLSIININERERVVVAESKKNEVVTGKSAATSNITMPGVNSLSSNKTLIEKHVNKSSEQHNLIKVQESQADKVDTIQDNKPDIIVPQQGEEPLLAENNHDSSKNSLNDQVLAEVIKSDTNLQFSVLPEIEDTESLMAEVEKPKGFWQRAAQVAKQANRLGVKSVDGETDGSNRFRLSFNSFSVEKK